MTKKLAIVITHPIQYYVPVFQTLAKQCRLKVFYTWGCEVMQGKFDPGFGKEINWDLPLLDGYEFEFLENLSKHPGSNHRKGIINRDLIQKIEAFDPDAILIYGHMYSSHFKAMRYFKGRKPVWFRGDSTLLNDRSDFKSLIRYLYLNTIYHFIDKAFYVGRNNKEYFKKFGVAEKNLIFAPHAIDNDRFSTTDKDKAFELRKSLGLSSQDVLLLYAGKFDKGKNIELLLNAFIQLNKEFDSIELSTVSTSYIHLLLVGNGELEATLKEKSLIFNEGRPFQLIHFMDFQNQIEMPNIYAACDLFCLPSRNETWGLSVNEAMASGKAILVSDKVGCAIDLVENGQNGFIFKSDDISDILSALRKCVECDLSKMGSISKSKIKKWSFDEQVYKFINYLNEIN